jgi:16S rRNA (cytosine1402-N4)-methyltransferase
MPDYHQPVMVAQVLDLLNPQPGETVVDGTVGHGGHALELATRVGKEGTLVAFDWDEAMLETARRRLADAPCQTIFVHADYRQIPDWMAEKRPRGADCILLDLGVNWQHFADPTRGFTFQEDAPLDMRMDRSRGEPAAAWLNRASFDEIRRALAEYGGERHAAAIAKKILERRRQGAMKTTQDLVHAVLEAVPPRLRDRRIHPATRTFQAVRIAVNRELEELDDALRAIALTLREGGRMAVLSYHSGEDRAAKRAFRSLGEEFEILTQRPLRPSGAEVAMNPSARSARLRAVRRERRTQ